jgi:PhnB protein
MSRKALPLPPGYHSVNVAITVKGGAAALEFYKKAFGAETVMTMPDPSGSGKMMHAEFRIGDSRVMLNDEFPEYGSKSPATLGGTGSTVHLYVNDVDAVFARAVEAGAKVKMPPTDMFWGDRFAKLEDPFGHSWALATHIEEVSPEECQRRMMAEMGGKK